jgi:hypothetical protein
MFTCEIDLAPVLATWREACAEIARGMNRGVERGVTEAIEAARQSHPYTDRTGALTASLRGYLERSAAPRGGGQAVGVMTAGARYASYVEAGTGPHVIEAKNRTALHFEMGGEEVFARRVHHPGSRAFPFMGPAVLKAERVITAEVELAIARAACLFRE